MRGHPRLRVSGCIAVLAMAWLSSGNNQIEVAAGQHEGAKTTPAATQAPEHNLHFWHFTSDQHQVALLELFASQESAASPHVERTIARLPHEGYGFDKVVPLVYHVSRWPHLGWVDPLSHEEFINRQNEYVSRGTIETTHAPQIILNGEEFKQHGESLRRAIDEIKLRPSVINLELYVEQFEGGRALEVFGRADRSTVATLYSYPASIGMILFEMDVRTEVRGGENKGKTLVGDYVVRGRSPLLHLRLEDDFMEMGATFPLDRAWRADRLGVAAYVQQETSGRILQAVGGLLDPKAAQRVPAEP
jgi:hypothetical protein